MKARYPEIFNDNFKLSQMDAISTNFNRTISSGISHFFGLFDMFKGEPLPFPNTDRRLQPPKLTIDPNLDFLTPLPLGYMPIPITSKLNQRILMPIRDDCPYGNASAIAAKKRVNDYVMKSPKVLELLEQAAAKYGIKNVEDINFKVNGNRTVDIESLFYLGDYAIQDYFHNPNAIISKVGSNEVMFRRLVTAYSVASLARFNDTVYTKNIISELLLEVLNRTKEVIHKDNYDLKYFYYSGHDDMMSALL